MMAAEVTGSKGTDGIYFLPEENDHRGDTDKLIGVEGKIDAADKPFSDGTGYTIYAEGGVLKISEMPAVRRLALGLAD